MDPVSSIHQIKDSGIMFSSDLQWNLHFKNIISKAYKMFYTLRHTFTSPSPIARKRLYLTLVRSHLVYCSPLWRPYLIKEIEHFQRLQCRVTKFILNNYELDYKKSRLSKCQILPLMYFLELIDILFLIKSLKSPTPAFNIHHYITFNTSTTRSGSSNKLIHKFASTNNAHHFYFNRITCLWNSLPVIDLNLISAQQNQNFINISGNILIKILTLKYIHTYHYLCPCNQYCGI